MEARNSAPPGAMWQDVLALVYPIIQDHARLKTAASSYAAKLPSELLVEVFAYLPLWDRVRAATVCHKWRDASLGSSSRLWSVAWTSIGLDVCRFLLNRASTVPVTFHVEIGHDTPDLVYDVIAQHLHHIRVLDLSLFWNSPVEEPTWDAAQIGRRLSAALQGPAPVLESFKMVSCHRWLHIDLGTVPCLNNHVLVAIDLRGFSLSSLASCSGAQNVRSLTIITPDTSRGFILEHWALMCSFPVLDTLSIKLMYPTCLPAAGTVFPVALRRLSLELSGDIFLHLSCAGRFAQLDSLCVSFSDGYANCAPFATVLPLFQIFVPASAAIHFTGACFEAKIVDAAGRVLVLRAVRCDPAWSVAFATATRLCIGGLEHLSHKVGDAVTALPAVEELTLDVTMCHRISDTHGFRWPPLACPRLRAVNVYSPRGGPPFELRVLSDALRDSLGAGPGKLATLVIDGVRICAPPGVDIATALRRIADTVSILNSGAIWPECYSVWGKPWDRVLT